MEELQDAIEDVQYLQAVNSKDTGPSPTEPWPFPSEKQLEEFNAERLKKDGGCFSLERICGGVLGLYLVRARDRGHNLKTTSMSLSSPTSGPPSILLAVAPLSHSAVWDVLQGDGRGHEVRVHVGRDPISGKTLPLDLLACDTGGVGVISESHRATNVG